MFMGWSEDLQRKADRETDEINALARILGYGEMLYYIPCGPDVTSTDEADSDSRSIVPIS